MPAYNKVIYNGVTLVDLTSDTVTAASLLSGVTAHAADGTVITGTYTGGGSSVDLSSDTVTAATLAKGVTAHAADGTAITGTAEITIDNEVLTFPAGFIVLVQEEGGE